MVFFPFSRLGLLFLSCSNTVFGGFSFSNPPFHSIEQVSAGSNEYATSYLDETEPETIITHVKLTKVKAAYMKNI